MDDFGNRAKRFLWKSILWLAIILVIGTTLFVCFVRFTSYSTGYRAGEVIKFSRKGFIVKTYEGEMNLGGFRDNNQGEVTPTIWPFSVYRGSDEVKSQLVQAMEDGNRVRLYYKERYVKLFWYGDTKYFIDKVEIVQ